MEIFFATIIGVIIGFALSRSTNSDMKMLIKDVREELNDSIDYVHSCAVDAHNKIDSFKEEINKKLNNTK